MRTSQRLRAPGLICRRSGREVAMRGREGGGELRVAVGCGLRQDCGVEGYVVVQDSGLVLSSGSGRCAGDEAIAGRGVVGCLRASVVDDGSGGRRAYGGRGYVGVRTGSARVRGEAAGRAGGEADERR